MNVSDALFPPADYKHHLSVKRGDPARFYAPTAERDEILREHAQWLDEQPALYAGALPGSEPFLAETARMLEQWLGLQIALPNDATAAAVAIGKAIEPDIVLLEKNEQEIFRVVAGSVSFPSSWSFAEKLGQPLDLVHSVVPDLNESLGHPISNFLAKIQPGASWERSNWGLSASPERNQHPTRKIPRLTPPITLDRVWLRVEDQILTILPETRALLFGIRIVTHTITDLIASSPDRLPHFRRAITTMPEPMAAYKNFAAIREDLITLLDATKRS